MKLNNGQLLDIAYACKEILNFKDEKGQLKNPGKFFWNMGRNVSVLKKTAIELETKKQDLKNDVTVAIKNEPDEFKKNELLDQLNKSNKALMEQGDHDISLFKISMEEFDVVCISLSGNTKSAIFEFLMEEV